ncbi:hypothetical protein [Erwinia amylovora]|uniref:Uncharacterized protein n=1 Tax=Erwinia amylovora TaxID=552 RepID=A0ABX7MIJ4_ERWAM|nr:hypothetical protein [Erwinia amylovora]CDK13687.1 putative membrane protein [Erwinia amylovora LA635]CDK17054.1 hypothetical protein LA636_0061 [Erwinia amylovora LA636]CDK20423.1 putative membrane protein [Erwinia amylovora LA637]ATZ10033.1 hypothetical protein AD997_00330 [Erwinia amylovora]MBZ2389977.1 hypothetical protein [Erwinia amylovora]
MSNATKEPSIVDLFFQALSFSDYFFIALFFLLLWWVIEVHKSDYSKDKAIKFKLASFLAVIVLLINVANIYSVINNSPTTIGKTHNSFGDM